MWFMISIYHPSSASLAIDKNFVQKEISLPLIMKSLKVRVWVCRARMNYWMFQRQSIVSTVIYCSRYLPSSTSKFKHKKRVKFYFKKKKSCGAIKTHVKILINFQYILPSILVRSFIYFLLPKINHSRELLHNFFR